MEENIKFPSYSPANKTSTEILDEELDLGLRRKDPRRKAAERSMRICQELGHTSYTDSKSFTFAAWRGQGKDCRDISFPEATTTFKSTDD